MFVGRTMLRRRRFVVVLVLLLLLASVVDEEGGPGCDASPMRTPLSPYRASRGLLVAETSPWVPFGVLGAWKVLWSPKIVVKVQGV